LEETAKACRAECTVQKARKEAEAKVREEAKKRRIKKKKKKKTLEYLQQLQDKVLAENTALLEGAEGSQIVGSKHKEVSPKDNRECQLTKKVKEK